MPLFLGVQFPLSEGECRRLYVRVNGGAAARPGGAKGKPCQHRSYNRPAPSKSRRAWCAPAARLILVYSVLGSSLARQPEISIGSPWDGWALLRGDTFDGAEELQPNFADAMARAEATR
jgi:hypothetical protein